MAQLACELFEKDKPLTESDIQRNHADRSARIFDAICEKHGFSKKVFVVQPLHLIKQWLEEETKAEVLIEKIQPMLSEYKRE